jgi:hypothetical protein
MFYVMCRYIIYLHTNTRAALSSLPDLWGSTQPRLWKAICLGAPKITEDVVSGVHMRLTRVLYVLAQFRIRPRQIGPSHIHQITEKFCSECRAESVRPDRCVKTSSPPLAVGRPHTSSPITFDGPTLARVLRVALLF